MHCRTGHAERIHSALGVACITPQPTDRPRLHLVFRIKHPCRCALFKARLVGSCHCGCFGQKRVCGADICQSFGDPMALGPCRQPNGCDHGGVRPEPVREASSRLGGRSPHPAPRPALRSGSRGGSAPCLPLRSGPAERSRTAPEGTRIGQAVVHDISVARARVAGRIVPPACGKGDRVGGRQALVLDKRRVKAAPLWNGFQDHSAFVDRIVVADGLKPPVGVGGGTESTAQSTASG